MPMLEERVIALEFLTPAFLGDAALASELRSPPFKALLRRWWRIAWTQGRAPDPKAMQEEEGPLFGHAWLKYSDERGKPRSWAMKSRVQLAVLEWRSGDLRSWPDDPLIRHPEVGAHGRDVGAHLYLGYGPLGYEDKVKTTELNRLSAFRAGTRIRLRIRYPCDLRESIRLDDVLKLWDALGTLGSRHRNGWGSLAVVGQGNASCTTVLERSWLDQFTRELDDCLLEDWSHAIGRDKLGALIWDSKDAFGTWAQAMKELARIKISLRTSFPMAVNRDAARPVIEKRHILAYPVTNHGILEWSKRNANGSPRLTPTGRLQQTMRLANQLCCKVIRGPDSKFRILIAHLPHRVPVEMLRLLPRESRRFIENCEKQTWQDVHALLDREMQRWSVR